MQETANTTQPLESRNSKQYKLRTLNRNVAVETYIVQSVGRILHEKQVENEGAMWKRRRRVQTKLGVVHGGGRTKTSGTRNSRKNEPSAVEAMPKTIERTHSGSATVLPFHRARRISLKYCAAYFSRKYGVCVAIAYFFPSRVQRLLLLRYASSTLEVR